MKVIRDYNGRKKRLSLSLFRFYSSSSSLSLLLFFIELLQASRGSIDVTIISAEKLNKTQSETIQQAISKIVGNKPFDLKTTVHPEILGGLQVLIGDRFLDLSVGSRVNELSKTLDSSV
jgi:ATP synthase F1 delta subunit